MPKNELRVISLAIIKRPSDGALLFDVYRHADGKCFYRPLGGGIEFGETSAEALVREFKEEIDKDIRADKKILVDERIYEIDGEKGHRIVFLYECSFVNPNDYMIEEFTNKEEEGHIAVWRTIAQVRAEGTVVYPEKIMELY